MTLYRTLRANGSNGCGDDGHSCIKPVLCIKAVGWIDTDHLADDRT
ncbi:MAG: hypothetical protein AAB883_00140 [Patescibacteria group bacterium]